MKVINISSSNDDLIAFVKAQRKALKVSTIADLLGVSKQLVYEWIDRGSLEAFDFDGSLRIDPKALAKFLENHRTIAAPAVPRRAA